MNNEQTEPEPATTTKTGYIYALLHVNYIYIGSTININRRYIEHRSNCKKKNYKLYQTIRELGGIDIFKLITIETVEFINIQELRKHEQYYYNLYRNNEYFTLLNKKECFLTTEEKESYLKTDKFKECNKNYYIKNKSKILERIKQQRNYKKLS